MKPYLKALILFPLILQGLATALVEFLNANADPYYQLPFIQNFLVVFILVAIPAFLISLITTKFRYMRYNIAAIVLCSALVSFFYYLTIIYLIEFTISFWGALLGMCFMTFCTLFILPWLLPKTKSS